MRTHLELRRTQRQLEESYGTLRELEAVRDSLVHMIVHDLRSSLTSLMCSISLLKRPPSDSSMPDAADEIDSAEQSLQAMTGMINDLLDVSRLEQHRIPIGYETADLHAIVRTAVDNVRRFDRTREIFVQPQRLVRVTCDKELIRRVVENLLSNGIKHTPSGLPLFVAVSAEPQPRVAVQDQGPGVPAAYREAIFEKFGIIHARRNREYHSAGLGLAFCKLAIEAHGGRIGVSSNEGQGSTFWFTLPEPATPSRAEEHRASQSDPRRS